MNYDLMMHMCLVVLFDRAYHLSFFLISNYAFYDLLHYKFNGNIVQNVTFVTRPSYLSLAVNNVTNEFLKTYKDLDCMAFKIYIQYFIGVPHLAIYYMAQVFSLINSC
jgi:hypothetical protein